MTLIGRIVQSLLQCKGRKLFRTGEHLTLTTSSSSWLEMRGLSKLLCRREPLPRDGS